MNIYNTSLVQLKWVERLTKLEETLKIGSLMRTRIKSIGRLKTEKSIVQIMIQMQLYNG